MKSRRAETGPVTRPRITGTTGDLEKPLIFNYSYFSDILLSYYNNVMYYIRSKVKKACSSEVAGVGAS